MPQEIRSSSSSKNETLASNDQHLLQFYRKQFEELHKKDDKYKDKIDNHLKRLVTDRHELEDEVIRRGEKICDLQKALVELQLSVFEERERYLRLSTENEERKKNEVQLHANIRQLLATTQQQDLRDKIIYILKRPQVEIGLRTDFPAQSNSLNDTLSATDRLKKELDHLKHQLDEVQHVTKKNANIILEDCLQALEKSKAKIMQDEIEIKKLQKKLSELQTQGKGSSKTVERKPTSFVENEPTVKIFSNNESNSSVRLFSYSENESVGNIPSLYESKPIDTASLNSFSNVCSHLKHMHLSLILLLKIISKITSILNTIQATKLYQQLANIPNAPTFMEIHVEENTIVQLESSLRQCTRLTYEINNMHKSLCEYVTNKEEIVEILRPELKHLKEMLKKMAAVTADNDLLNVGLRRTPFFEALRDSSVSISEKDKLHYLDNFKKIFSNSVELDQTASRAADFVESIIQKYSTRKAESQELRTNPDSFAITKKSGAHSDSALLTKDKVYKEKEKSHPSKDLEKLLGIYKTTLEEAEKLGLGGSSEMRAMALRLKSREKLLQELKKSDESSETEEKSIQVDRLRSDVRQSTETEDRSTQAQHKKSDDRWRSETDEKSTQVQHKKSAETEERSTQIQHKKLDERWRGETEEKSTQVQHKKSADRQVSEMEEKSTQVLREKSDERSVRELKKCHDNMNEAMTKLEILDTESPHFDREEILRNINKTLSKIKLVEQRRCSRDESVFRELASNVSELSTKFKELKGEFDVKHLRDQLSEYSSVTLGKLEELAKQSRNSVVAAESQIAAHRSNAKQLSGKLKETEDLLRESINECLTLKQTLKRTEEQHEIQNYNLILCLKEKLEKFSDREEIESILDDLTSYVDVRKDAKIDPFVCFYCKHGQGHQLCQEKIRDLTAEERKSRTQLKLLIQETKQEKERLMYHTEIAEKTSQDLVAKNEALQEAVRTLEKKNANLLEHLKLQKNRVKNMERFRRLEVEGFHTDIKNLKIKIQDLEKKLMKAVIIFENNSKDMELLKIVHDTAQRSKEATAALRRLKAKLYELEIDIKGL